MIEVDGDKLLVLQQEDIIKIAKRVTEGVYPLYYEMGKASAKTITNESLYKGLVDAFKGGKIGSISNNITKIWNSGKPITEEQKMAVKWLCMETNFNIDYAKTLYKPQRPEYANEIITKYTNRKVPHFFIAAKDKKKKQCEPLGDNIVDVIYKTIKPNKKLFRKANHLEDINYLLLLKDMKDLGSNEEVNKLFDKHNRHYGFNLRVDADDKRKNNISEICKQIKRDLLEIEPDEDKIICSLVKMLYERKSSRIKKLFWMTYGEQVYQSLQLNIDKIPQNYCKICGKRTNDNLVNGECSECHKKKIEEAKKKARRKKDKNGAIPLKTVKCIDCGKEFEVSIRSRVIRCEDCRKKKQLEWQRESMKKVRSKKVK